jgi:hypothetical protein
VGTPECTLDHKVQGVESPQLDARDEDEDEYEDEYECDEDEDEDEDEYPGRFCVRAVVVGGVRDGSTNVVEGISMGIA